MLEQVDGQFHAELVRDQRRLADTLLNVDLRLLLTPFTEAMIASAIQAAISPYSMAVAPDSSRKKRRNKLISLFLSRTGMYHRHLDQT